MTLADFKLILNRSGLPSAYLAFPANACPKMPFLTFQETGSSNFGADGKVFQPVRTMQVDLYTARKDPETEAMLENVLDDAGIFWNKYQTVEDNESCQRYTYEFQILGGN